MTVLLLTVDLTVIEVRESSAREWCSAERTTTFEYWFAQADLIHIDVAGPIPVRLAGGKESVRVFVDEYSEPFIQGHSVASRRMRAICEGIKLGITVP